MSVFGAAELEKRLLRMPGVMGARVSFFTGRAWIVSRRPAAARGAVSVLNASRSSWPYAVATVTGRERVGAAFAFPRLRTPPIALMRAIESRVVPPAGAGTPAGFALTLANVKRFLVYNDRVSGLPSRQATGPLLPFLGCDGGGCSLPLRDGGTIVDPNLPINVRDSL